MDTVQDVYGEYYEAKGREIPRHSSLTPEAKILWQRMEDLAWSVTYADGSRQELTEAVEEDVSNENIALKTVDKVLDQAILTAELEKPKSEVIGGFDKAISFVKNYGTDEQLFTALYQKAWTSFFWLEDFNVFE